MPNLPWIVELVNPPGIFLARQLTEPKTFDELEAERFESAAQLPLYRRLPPPKLDASAYHLHQEAETSPRSRWLMLHLPSEMLARAACEALAQAIPDPSPPWAIEDVEKVTHVFRTFVDALDQRKKK
jgi:hypothetical protein